MKCEPVDGGNNLLSILLSRTVYYGQTAGYEVILNINDNDGSPWPYYLLNPAIPAVDELLLAHTAISGHVEDHEQVTDHLGVHPGDRQ